jgi:hypothetical protein
LEYIIDPGIGISWSIIYYDMYDLVVILGIPIPIFFEIEFLRSALESGSGFDYDKIIHMII